MTLKPALENAPWGEALPNGLRVACLLEPRVAEHRLGTPLKMRLLVHNAGQEPVVIRTRTWHHIEPTARDAKGAEIKMESVTRYTRPPLVACRLVPGLPGLPSVPGLPGLPALPGGGGNGGGNSGPGGGGNGNGGGSG